MQASQEATVRTGRGTMDQFQPEKEYVKAVYYHPAYLTSMQCCCSVAQSCLTLCDPMDCSTPDFPVLPRLLELAQTHVCRVSDPIQSFLPLLSPSPPAVNLFQCQGLF